MELENLVRFVESEDDSTSIRQRIAERESDLRSIEVRLKDHSVRLEGSPEITVAWLEGQLGELAVLLTSHKEYVGLLNQDERNLFPEGLRAVQNNTVDTVVFQINGIARPFSSALLPVSLMSHSEGRGAEGRCTGDHASMGSGQAGWLERFAFGSPGQATAGQE